MPPQPHIPLKGDEATLFAEFDAELQRRVRALVRTSSVNIEDACSFAWLQFLNHQPDRERSWQAWLVQVARREAIRLNDLAMRTPATLGPGHLGREYVEPADPHAVTPIGVELREAFALLGELRPRIRRIAFLKAIGYSDPMIQEVTGDSRTRVWELVSRANSALAEAALAQERGNVPQPPRVARLQELEREPPQWLIETLGRPPGRTNHSANTLLLWRRAAIALDDYRGQLAGRSNDLDAAPTDPELASTHCTAWRAVQRYRDSRTRAREGRGAELGR